VKLKSPVAKYFAFIALALIFSSLPDIRQQKHSTSAGEKVTRYTPKSILFFAIKPIFMIT